MKNTYYRKGKMAHAKKTMSVDTSAKRGRGGNFNHTQTAYIKIPLLVVDFIYEKYPDLTIAVGIEKFLSECANKEI